jgi:purine-cytosine permease-like protein
MFPLIATELSKAKLPETVNNAASWLPLIGGLILAFFAYLLLKPFHIRKRNQYKRDYAEWQNKWLCMRCGATWTYR